MRIACFSDLHLRGPDDPVQQRFCAWLERETVDQLCLVGDLFEHWWHFGATPFSAYEPVVERLRGRALVFVPGNHDFHALSFFEEHLGGRCGAEITELWDGRKVQLLHGDHVDRSPGYRLVASVLRGGTFARLVDQLGPARAWRFLERLAGEPGGTPNLELVAAQVADARRRLRAGADMVVMGHTHAPGIYGFDEGIFVNIGDGAVHGTWLEIRDGIPTLHRLPG